MTTRLWRSPPHVHRVRDILTSTLNLAGNSARRVLASKDKERNIHDLEVGNLRRLLDKYMPHEVAMVTLSRQTRLLQRAGYELTQFWPIPYDMFGMSRCGRKTALGLY